MQVIPQVLLRLMKLTINPTVEIKNIMQMRPRWRLHLGPGCSPCHNIQGLPPVGWLVPHRFSGHLEGHALHTEQQCTGHRSSFQMNLTMFWFMCKCKPGAVVNDTYKVRKRILLSFQEKIRKCQAIMKIQRKILPQSVLALICLI